MLDDPSTPPTSGEPTWKQEYDQQQRAGLAYAHKIRWIMLLSLIGCLALMIYACVGPYGQERYGLLALLLAFAALFGGVFRLGTSPKARAAARDIAGKPAWQASPEDARIIRKIRWLVVPGVIALFSKDFVSTTSPWHERLQIGGILFATLGLLSMPFVLMQEEIRRVRREEGEKHENETKSSIPSDKNV